MAIGDREDAISGVIDLETTHNKTEEELVLEKGRTPETALNSEKFGLA